MQARELLTAGILFAAMLVAFATVRSQWNSAPANTTPVHSPAAKDTGNTPPPAELPPPTDTDGTSEEAATPESPSKKHQ